MLDPFPLLPIILVQPARVPPHIVKHHRNLRRICTLFDVYKVTTEICVVYGRYSTCMKSASHVQTAGIPPNVVRRHRYVFKAHRLLYHSTLGWRVIKKKTRSYLPKTDRLREWINSSLSRRQKLLHLRFAMTATSQKCAAVPRRARI